MALKHPENLLTVRWRRQPSSALAAAMAELASAVVDDADNQSRQVLGEIEHQLTVAHEAYHAGRQDAAVRGYRSAQALIYQRVDPRLSVRAVRRGTALPLDARFFRPLLAAGLELVEALEPSTPERGFAAPAELPAELVSATAALRQQGVRLADERTQEARQAMELAAACAERGQWSRALRLIESAKQGGLPRDEQEARQVRAALAVSEAAVRIQLGDSRSAGPLLVDAGRLFTEGDDLVGQAQTEFNRAALLQREGRRADADQALARAGGLLDRAAGRAEAGPAPQPVSRRAKALRGAPRRGSLALESLDGLRAARGMAVTYRVPGTGGGWFVQPVQPASEARERKARKSLTLVLGGKTIRVEWTAGGELPVEALMARYFEEHAGARELSGLIGAPGTDAELAVQLPHLYLYVLPIAMGDALRAVGDHAAAETLYLAAADYPFLNLAIELPALWRKLAENALAWGDRRYKADDLPGALEVYRKVLEPPGAAVAVPLQAPLYAHARLRHVGSQVREFLEGLAPDAAVPPIDASQNPLLLAVVLELRARVMQLNAGLDFHGLASHFVPIWSFEFLQGVARYLAQQAIQAEREFVRFQDKAEAESMSALQLQQAVEVTGAERQAATAQREAAAAEREVYALGWLAAQERVAGAREDTAEYEDMSRARIDYDEQILEKAEGIDPDDDRAVFGSTQRDRDTRVLEYEMASRRRQIDELQRAVDVAFFQKEAAEARVVVAELMEAVAALKAQAAAEQLAAFEDEFFTPDVWKEMASFMAEVARRYLAMATRVARMMQRAYNFEQDLSLQLIRADYTAAGVKGLLGGDLLLADIDSFTYDLVRRLRPKDVPIKQSLSLAELYPFPFASEFRRTGVLEFETRLLDFDLPHPGTFARRLERVEVEVEGVLPRGGIHGTLTNSGISIFRTAGGQLKFRIQPRETMPLSEYRIREDSIVFPAEGQQLALFEGAGVASTWKLEIPTATNDLDFRSLTDVRLVFHYRARFDRTLQEHVLQELAATPGAFARARKLALRWTFPDAYFHFRDTGRLDFALGAEDLPLNQTQPMLRHVALRLMGRESGIGGVRLRFATPGHAETTAADLDANGLASTGPGHSWQPLLGGSVLGDYAVELRAEEAPSLVVDGRLDLSGVDDVLVFLEYTFTPR